MVGYLQIQGIAEIRYHDPRLVFPQTHLIAGHLLQMGQILSLNRHPNLKRQKDLVGTL